MDMKVLPGVETRWEILPDLVRKTIAEWYRNNDVTILQVWDCSDSDYIQVQLVVSYKGQHLDFLRCFGMSTMTQLSISIDGQVSLSSLTAKNQKVPS